MQQINQFKKKKHNGSMKKTINENIAFFNRNRPQVVRSDGTTERFNPSRITQSILRETDISKKDARKVTETVSRILLTSDMRLVTAPFIREQVCGVLYDIDPKLRFQYTRLGMPYNDFKNRYGDLFDQFATVSDMGKKDITEKVIAEMQPDKIIEFIWRVGKEYIGVRNDIDELETGV